MRRGSYSTGFVIGLLLGLVLLLIATPLFGGVFERAGEDLDSFQSCNQGLIGTLAGKGSEGKCLNTQDATKTPEPKEGMRWQYLGKGWGCPEDEEAPDDEKKNAPYCWLLIPESRSLYSVGEIAEAKCENLAPGAIVVVRKGSYTGCYPQGHARATIGADESVIVRYLRPEAQGDLALQFEIFDSTGKRIGTRLVRPSDDSGEVDMNFVPYSYLGDNMTSQADKSILNNGGRVKVTVTQGGSGSEEFPIREPVQKYCSLAQQTAQACRGKIAQRTSGGHCVFTDDTTCQLRDLDDAVCTVAYDNGRVASDSPCKGVRFPGSVFCYVRNDLSGTVNDEVYLCEASSLSTCKQVGYQRDNWGFGDEEYEEILRLYPECRT